jgi:hypothetical protein
MKELNVDGITISKFFDDDGFIFSIFRNLYT